MNFRKIQSARGLPSIAAWPVPWGATFYYRCRLPLQALSDNDLADVVLLNFDGTPELIGDILGLQSAHDSRQLDVARATRPSTVRILEIDDDLEHRPALPPGLYWQSPDLYKAPTYIRTWPRC